MCDTSFLAETIYEVNNCLWVAVHPKVTIESMLASLFLVNTTHISMGSLRSGVGDGIPAAFHVW